MSSLTEFQLLLLRELRGIGGAVRELENYLREGVKDRIVVIESDQPGEAEGLVQLVLFDGEEPQ